MRKAMGFVGVMGFVLCGSAVDSEGMWGIAMAALACAFLLMAIYGLGDN